jgi:3-hydroxyisobutyrate dehydrogenase-like beta-hydroxyacid dehydrogenase
VTQSDIPVVGVLHPGRMGAAIAIQARANSQAVLWYSAQRSAATIQRAASAGLEAVHDLGDLIHRADILLSVCPPVAAEDIAQSIAGYGYAGTFVEANAISPARCMRIVGMLQGTGATVVDGAIFGPPPTDRSSVRLYLAGEPQAVARVVRLFTGTSVQPVVLDGAPPIASALKIADASYHKAVRALAAIAHALAAEYGVTEHLLSEANRISGSPLIDLEYLSSVAARAWRWAPELVEVADALVEVDLPPQLAQAASEVLVRWDPAKDDWYLPVNEILKLLRLGSRPAPTSPQLHDRQNTGPPGTAMSPGKR